MQPEISIIMPCLNSDKTIKRALLSIFNQTIINKIDIIVVDGGSRDQTLNILNSYKGKIRVIHAKEKGVPSQISEGILKAKTKYIGFVDSDDYIDPNMYEILYNNIKEIDGDFVSCKIDLRTAKTINIPLKSYEQTKIYNPKQSYLLCSASRVNKLIKKEILLKVIAFYNSNVKNVLWEDTIFGYTLHSYSSKIIDINLPLYHCIPRKDSYSRKSTYGKDEIIKLNNLCKKYDELYSAIKNPLYFRLYTNPLKNMFTICLHNRIRKPFYFQRKKMYKMIRESFAFKATYDKCTNNNTLSCLFGGEAEINFYRFFLEYLKTDYRKLDSLLTKECFKKIKHKIFKR